MTGRAPSVLMVGGFTDHPDEEGTETKVITSLERGRWQCFTDHPDEEGTETPFFGTHSTGAASNASPIIPMRRELKLAAGFMFIW